MQKPLYFLNKIRIFAAASAVGREERLGPLGELFDFSDPADRFGADTWEHGEEALSHTVLNLALAKAGINRNAVDLLLAGDLQNQCIASSFGCGNLGIPYLGLYGACSTSCEGLLIASAMLSGCPRITRAAVVTTSHHAAAERQFRLPLEYGGQRPPTSQWTATAGGAFLLDRADEGDGGVILSCGMAGRVVDGGINDASNMGAAMAPAAADTILSYFAATKEDPASFDAIVTGDLGAEGSELLALLLRKNGLDLCGRHLDCGTLLYDTERKDVHAGGSGCGCSASVLAAYFIPKLASGLLKRILFLATGALMSPSGLLQGGNILGTAPLLVMCAPNEA